MEGSIITVVDPSKCQTSIRKIKGVNPSDPEGTLIYYYCQVMRGESRTRFLERFPRKLNQDFRRTDADSRAAFAPKRLKWHGFQYKSFPLLYNVILESELR